MLIPSGGAPAGGPPPAGRGRWRALVVAALLGAPPASWAQGWVEVSVVEGSRYTVDASGASLPQVLTELGRQAGFRVADTRPGEDRGTVDIELVDKPLDRALARLLEKQNHVIVYRRGEAAEGDAGPIEKVILLSPPQAGAKAPATKGGASPLAGPVPAIAAARPEPPDPAESGEALDQSPQPDPDIPPEEAAAMAAAMARGEGLDEAQIEELADELPPELGDLAERIMEQQEQDADY